MIPSRAASVALVALCLVLALDTACAEPYPSTIMNEAAPVVLRGPQPASDFAHNSFPSHAPRTPTPTYLSKRAYVFTNDLIRVAGLLALSATFAGLTMGIMGVDSLTLEIIAESGPMPDREYAQKLLPFRRSGHETLCTLILSNMLANVLIVQQMSDLQDAFYNIVSNGLPKEYRGEEAQDDYGAIVGFVISTLVIFIFTEILPMSLCKSKYSLAIASAGLPIVRVAQVLTFPVSVLLGRFLDWLIPHEVGQVYDRNELKKLMMVHCENRGTETGLAATELAMMVAAMDFHEKVVGDVMTPVERVFAVNMDDEITPDFIERLWRSGRSRVPVASSDGRFCDVLLVRDLITVSTSAQFGATRSSPHRSVNHSTHSDAVQSPVDLNATANSSTATSDSLTVSATKPFPPPHHPSHNHQHPIMTVREILRLKSRNVPTVDVRTPLPQMLKFFQKVNTHMAIVHSDDPLAGTLRDSDRGASANRVGDDDDDDNMNHDTHAEMVASPHRHAPHGSPFNRRAPHGSIVMDSTYIGFASSVEFPHRRTVGVITLEDVVEELIHEEIYDEYDSEEVEEPKNNLTLQELGGGLSAMGEMGASPNAGGAGHFLMNATITDFQMTFSATQRHGGGTMGRDSTIRPAKPPKRRPRVNFYSYYVHEEDLDLSDGQKWAVAYFLCDTCALFAGWKVGYVKYLLDELEDEQLRPTTVRTATDQVSSSDWMSPSCTDEYCGLSSGGPKGSRKNLSTPSRPLPQLVAAPLLSYDTRQQKFLESASDSSMILYRRGEPAHFMTLVLSGCVEALVGKDAFPMKFHSFRIMGEEAMLTDLYIPEFTAIVRSPTRLFRIPRDLFERVSQAVHYQKGLTRAVSSARLTVDTGYQGPGSGSGPFGLPPRPSPTTPGPRLLAVPTPLTSSHSNAMPHTPFAVSPMVTYGSFEETLGKRQLSASATQPRRK